MMAGKQLTSAKLHSRTKGEKISIIKQSRGEKSVKRKIINEGDHAIEKKLWRAKLDS